MSPHLCQKYRVLPPPYLYLQMSTEIHLHDEQYLQTIFSEEVQLALMPEVSRCNHNPFKQQVTTELHLLDGPNYC